MAGSSWRFHDQGTKYETRAVGIISIGTDNCSISKSGKPNTDKVDLDCTYNTPAIHPNLILCLCRRAILGLQPSLTDIKWYR